MIKDVNWPAAGGCVGFLTMEACGLLAGVCPEQIFLRAGVAALVGTLIGVAIKCLPDPPPEVPTKRGKSEDQGSIIDAEVGDEGDYEPQEDSGILS